MHTTTTISTIDRSSVATLERDDLEVTARMMRARAESLEAQAEQLPTPLAVAYLRRAEELRHEALQLVA
jgi:hypothetical protein